MFRAIPGATVLYPGDAVAAERLTETAARRSGICYVRTGRPKTPVLYANDEQFPVPGFKVLRQSASDRAAIITAGVTLHEALRAYEQLAAKGIDRKSTRLNSSHSQISYAVFCLKKKKKQAAVAVGAR